MAHNIWSMVSLIGLAGWITSTLCLIFRAFPEKGRFLVRPALRWGGVLAVSYIVWIIGLINA